MRPRDYRSVCPRASRQVQFVRPAPNARVLWRPGGDGRSVGSPWSPPARGTIGARSARASATRSCANVLCHQLHEMGCVQKGIRKGRTQGEGGRPSIRLLDTFKAAEESCPFDLRDPPCPKLGGYAFGSRMRSRGVPAPRTPPFAEQGRLTPPALRGGGADIPSLPREPGGWGARQETEEQGRLAEGRAQVGPGRGEHVNEPAWGQELG